MIEFTTLYVVGMSLLILMGFGVLVYQIIDNRKFKKQIEKERKERKERKQS